MGIVKSCTKYKIICFQTAKSITLMMMYIVLGLHLHGGNVNYSLIDLTYMSWGNYFLSY